MREDSRLRGVEAGLPALFPEQRQAVGWKDSKVPDETGAFCAYLLKRAGREYSLLKFWRKRDIIIWSCDDRLE